MEAIDFSTATRSRFEHAFFPVSKVRLGKTDDGYRFRRQWAVVADDTREIFSTVAENYRLISNEYAYELGSRAFKLVFGEKALAELALFNVVMPKTGSWVHMDLAAETLSFVPMGEDRWLPFLRVTNSYNRSRALGFTVGICRWICTNGMIFGEQSFKLKIPHQNYENIEDIVDAKFSRWRFDAAAYRDKLEKLTRLSVPPERFVAGMLEILAIEPPVEQPKNQARWEAWQRLGSCLRGLGEQYRRDLGDNAYALINAASDYARDLAAPLMTAGRVFALQQRCGRWVDKILDRYGPSLGSGAQVPIKPGSLTAARRLAALA